MSFAVFRDRFFQGIPRYRWLETIGRGGMGIVFRAEDLELEEIVAIKVLSPDLGADKEALLSRFKREINLNRKIKHPNVARIHDFGTSGDFPYITMEYVPGKDLRTLIQDEGCLVPTRTISILRQIALGTHAAHKLEIIHRDLKSSNVIVDENGAVAILDFGLARGKVSSDLTLDSYIIGTPHYMSPEQALGKQADARSDIYSIGIMAFECLTGHVPFTSESPIAIGMKQVSEPVPDDMDRIPNLSPGLRDIVLKALEKDPDKRYQSAADLEAELEAELVTSQLEAADSTSARSAEPAFTEEAPRTIDPSFVMRKESPAPAVSEAERLDSAPPSVAARDAEPPAPETPSRAGRTPSPAGVRTVIRHRAPTILIVEDDYLLRKAAAKAVAEFGWKVLEAGSGQEALEVLMNKSVDLVLMDVTLPGMDGFDVTRIVKSQANLAQTPIVLTSPRLDRSQYAFGLQTGATDVVPRNLGPLVLANRLWKVLKHRGFVSPETEEALAKAVPGAAGGR